MFHRDIHKSKDLLYLFDTIIDLYEKYPNPASKDSKCGILIGSPVSKDMCNYYMSRLYHYATEQVYKITASRNKTRRTNLIIHIAIYMDDILIYGRNKRDIHNAMNMLVEYAKSVLGLIIKPDWRKFLSMYRNEKGETKGNLLDFMGFRFHGGDVKQRVYFGRKVRYRKVWVTIRDTTFIKARRKFIRFRNMVKRKIVVSDRYAKSVSSYFGCFKQTDSVSFRKNNGIDRIMKIARKMVSNYAKGKQYKTDAYYLMWRGLLS